MDNKFTFNWCIENENEALAQYDFFVREIEQIILQNTKDSIIAYYYLLLSWLTLKKLVRHSLCNSEIEYDAKLISTGQHYFSCFSKYLECEESKIIEYCYDFISSPNRNKYEIIDFIKNVPYIDESALVVLNNYQINELWHTVLGGYIEYYGLNIKELDTKEGIYDLMFFLQHIDEIKDVQEFETLLMKKCYWLDELACDFINGSGVKRNTAEGIQLLHKSIVSEGNYGCRFTPLHLAMIYHYELDGYFDKCEALKWYKEAKEEADLCEDDDMLSFVQYQMNLLNNPVTTIPEFSAKADFIDTLNEPINKCRHYISLQNLSGQITVGDKIYIKIGDDELFATIKGILLYNLLVDNVVTENNTYTDLVLSFDKQEDEKIMEALIIADDDSIDYSEKILINKI